ncbi:MAG: site-2 protease family protein [Candidatus Bipolaricaulia bacterium]
MNFDVVLEVVLSLIAVFMAIVLHEVAHGYVAFRLGDPTARNRGRLTLNPLAHIDPVGTILVPLGLAVVSFLFGTRLFLFGWAKPVPINPGNFRNPLRGMLFVALAGPVTNIALALVTAGVFRLIWLGVSSIELASGGFGFHLLEAVLILLSRFVLYNLLLAVFNLIPIPPLDGSRVLMYFLKAEGRRFLLSVERYGFLILMALLYLGGLSFLFRAVDRISRVLLGV